MKTEATSERQAKAPGRRSTSIVELILQSPDARRELDAVAVKIARSFVELFGGPEKMRETLLKIAANVAVFARAFPEIEARFSRLEKGVYEALPEYSWFFDPNMDADEFISLADLVAAKDAARIDATLVVHFNRRLDDIEGELSVSHPDRAAIFRDAFAAHREKRYTLAIPAFLAQADGISRDLIGVEYFRSSESVGQSKKLIGKLSGDLFLNSALRTLLPTGAMRKHSSKTKPGDFNRHTVMHGIDTAYASEMNSLRAVSVLNFMSTMNELKRKHLTPTA